jgi:hypothetical protein
MKSKQVGLTEYNDIILSVYDANPIVNVSKALTKNAPEPKATTKKANPKTGTLVKETLRLRNTAVLNLKLAQNIFKYEKSRLSSLKPYLDGDKTSEVEDGKSEEEEDENKKKKKNSRWLRNLGRGLRRLIKKLFKKLVPKGVRARGRLLRKRINKFKRRVKVNIKRQWRKFTKPFRQARRFTQPFRRNVATRFRRLGRNLGRPFRQGKRFAQTLVRDPRRALQQTQRAFGQAKQFASAGMATARQFAGNKINQTRKFAVSGYNEVRSGVNFARDMLGRAGFKGPKLPSLGGGGGGGFFGRFTGMGEKFKQGKNAFLGGLDAVTTFGGKVVKSVSATVGRWKNVLTDPKTYASIKNGAATAWKNVKGATKKLYDDFFAWLAGTPQFRKLIESKIGKKITEKIIQKGGKKVLIKIIGRMVVGLATVLALWDMVVRWTEGDYEGAAIAALSAIPVVGLIAVVVDILRDLFPKSYEGMVAQITGMNKDERNAGIKSGVDTAITPMENAGGNDIAGVPMAADGMVTGNTPQLVIVGDGGEEEYIVPKSKLSYFLGSDTALDFLNFGGSQLLSTVKDYINKAGLGSQASSIKELAVANDLPYATTNNVKGISPAEVRTGNIAEKILEFLREGFESILEPIKGIFNWVKENVLDNPIVKGLGAIGAHIFGGSPAAAATMDRFNLDLSGMSADGVFNTKMKTGKSAYIGGSSDYHIDTKFNASLSMEEKVAMMDQLAAGYAAQGRKIEFSNDMIANTVYDPNASMEEKSALLQRAFEAHNLPRGRAIDQGGFNSIDYYAPLMGENRFGSSVEGHDILIPTIGGSKVNYAKGGGYGGYITLTDDQGRVVLKTGHGDSRTARSGSVDVSALNKDDAVGEDPGDMDNNIFAQMLQRQIAQKQSTQVPQVLPIPIGSGSSINIIQKNTPAWGHAVIGN